MKPGRVIRVNGPLVEVVGLDGASVAELVEVGTDRIPGEVVGIAESRCSVQAYEYTGGVAPGAPVVRKGVPLSAALGPWLLGGVFDGLLRPLKNGPTWLRSGSLAQPGSDRAWAWQPRVHPGDDVVPGTLLGTIDVPGIVEYRVLAAPDLLGTASFVCAQGLCAWDHRLVQVGDTAVTMTTQWPVRVARPYLERRAEGRPLVTGQRVLDLLFPLGRGGTAAVPGGFGTGKTLLLQQVAKWCDADVIVYVGCGERGNEMADVLDEFSQLADPRTGGRLTERTVIIANTSNMPMMAREASVYSGITVAEHFRDMGYDTVVIADSTSRWAEALREFASRTGVMPAEEGYPADLASSLAAFYERAGVVTTLAGSTGSVTVIGAVSPPGGDMSEPVTALTQRFVRDLWSLDHNLAYARHYPALNWTGSFARDVGKVAAWYRQQGDAEWAHRRQRLSTVLAESDRLAAMAELMGANSLPDRERIALLGGRLAREGVLQQSAIDPNDAYCTPAKGAALADAVLDVVQECHNLVDHSCAAAVIEAFDFSLLLRASRETKPDDTADVDCRRATTIEQLRALQ